jgi:sulfane dehydrogenase subunit SoxC
VGSAVDRLAAGARVAGPDEGISLEELQLATRNHGMPLEALRYDVTPVGLHYLLVHYDIPDVNAATWSLTLSGHVERQRSLTLVDLQARPTTTMRVTIECAGNGRARLLPRPVSQPWLNEAVGTAEWTGTPLAPLLEECGVRRGAVDVVFAGADHGTERGVEQDYARGLSLDDALRGDVLLAWAMNGQPLPPQHGAPVRLVAPGWYGMAHVKWLRSITVIDRPFDGFQNATAYRIRRPVAGQEALPEEMTNEPVTRIKPRALMQPPGFPDFMSRVRVVDAGPCVLRGRAWSGEGPIDTVEVSVDSGATWHAADLEPAPARWAWRAWTYTWTADPGETELSCRVTDARGNTQPGEQPWNRQGMANTMVQRIPVVVRSTDVTPSR